MHLPQGAKGGVAAAVLDGARGTTAARLLLMVPVVEGGTGELDPKRRIDVAAGAELRRAHEGGERAASPAVDHAETDGRTRHGIVVVRLRHLRDPRSERARLG